MSSLRRRQGTVQRNRIIKPSVELSEKAAQRLFFQLMLRNNLGNRSFVFKFLPTVVNAVGFYPTALAVFLAELRF